MGGDPQNGSATIVEALLKLITMDKLGVSLIKEKKDSTEAYIPEIQPAADEVSLVPIVEITEDQVG